VSARLGPRHPFVSLLNHIRNPDLPTDPESEHLTVRMAATLLSDCVWLAILDRDVHTVRRKAIQTPHGYPAQPVYLSTMRTTLDFTIALRGGDAYRIEAVVRAHDLHGDRKLAMFALIQGNWWRYRTSYGSMLSRIHWMT